MGTTLKQLESGLDRGLVRTSPSWCVDSRRRLLLLACLAHSSDAVLCKVVRLNVRINEDVEEARECLALCSPLALARLGSLGPKTAWPMLAFV